MSSWPMLSASMTCTPSSANILPTKDFPVAIPPVSPIFSKGHLLFTTKCTESQRNQPLENSRFNLFGFSVTLSLCGEWILCSKKLYNAIASAYLGGFHSICHQHCNGKRAYATGYGRNHARDFCYFRVHVADEN